MKVEELRPLIKSYKDFPSKGIVFLDALGILQENKIFEELIVNMSSSRIISEAQAIVSIDARGFIFGSAISLRTSKPMIVARKKGKLPGELISKNYQLEYGIDSLYIQKECLKKFNSFAIVDDLLATGGTANCVKEILMESSKRVTGLVVVIEIESLKAKSSLNFPVESQIKY